MIVEGDFEVRALVAPDGQTGLAQAWAYRPDLILLDLILPDLTGVEICRSLKASSATRNIPVLIVTASFDADSARHAREAGADGFIHKLYSFSQLPERLATYLGEPFGDLSA